MMTHTYRVTGMTCNNCEAKVKSKLLMLPEVEGVEVSREEETATITMQKHVSLGALQEALGGSAGKYRISAMHHSEAAEQAKDGWQTYKPLFLVFAFITGLSLVAAYTGGRLQGYVFMNVFMAGFFLAFSFFKLLDVKAFAESYAMYDVVAMQWKGYGYIYPFIELALGVAYLTGFNPVVTNVSTAVVMGVSSIGVIRSVIKKQQIQCACLGAVFNLPMSTITIIEDVLMVVMSLVVLLFHA